MDLFGLKIIEIRDYMTTIVQLQNEYGPDFLKKLPLYKTAILDGKDHVGIVKVNVPALLVIVRHIGGREEMVSVTRLSNFVL